MSISLVVFRLEIADDSAIPASFEYKAPHFEVPVSTYAEVAGKLNKLTKSDITTLKGRREFQTLTIETYYSNSDNLEDTQDLSSLDELSCAVEDMAEKDVNEGAEAYHTGSACEEFKYEEIDKQETELSNEETGGCRSKSRSPQAISSEGHPPLRKYPKRDKNIIKYFSGNPAVELTEGILHLFKNSVDTSLEEEVSRSEMICMLSVPASITVPELLKFVAPVLTYLELMKIVRDMSPNQYMVLLKFRSQKYSDEFYQNFNNRPFNSFEPDICRLVYVAKLEALSSSEGAGTSMNSLTELPSCPVCLERMDESVDGILTILCNHSFHSSCMSQCNDTTCPVCRYILSPEYSADNRCFQCNSQESLWICLICGHVGCGRYAGGHAFSHFKDTNHTYSMQLGSNHVWDYVGDNYVHRLVANKGDGKLVEVDEGGNLVREEKLDSITLEYTYLLTSQLESQRLYFEEKMELIEKEAQKQTQEMELKSKKALEECEILDQRLSSATKEKQATEKKFSQLHDRMGKVLHELRDEKEMNKCLRQNQTQWQDKVKNLEDSNAAKDKEMSELRDQLRDIMFYLEANQKLSASSDVTQEELQDGQIVVGASNTPTRKAHRKKGK